MDVVTAAKLGAMALGAVALVATSIGTSVRRARQRREMRSAPQAVADHAVVTLTGRVRAVRPLLTAPLSGTPCVLHRSAATPHGGGAPIVQIEMCEFELVTSDGPIRVCGTAPRVTIRPARVVPRDLDRERAFLRAWTERRPVSVFGFDEVVIEPGMTLSVHGVARVEVAADWERGEERAYRDGPTSVRLEGDLEHPLTVGVL